MPWQDIVLTMGIWINIVSFIPSIITKDKPSIATSVPHVFVSAAYAITFYSLSLWSSTISATCLMCVWIILSVQKTQKK